MYAPSGRGLRLKLDEPFAIYSRRAFDLYLLDCARAAGATVFKEKISHQRISKTDNGWIVKGANGAEWTGKFLVGADGANSAIAKRLAGPLPASEMEVAFGYRTPLPGNAEAPTVVAFLPGWVGYAWAFPRLDHISFGIATSQDAFDHTSLDALLWDFMVSYYGGYRTGRRGDREARYRTGSGSDRVKSSTMRIWKRPQALNSS